MTKRDILLEDVAGMDKGLARLSEKKQDIWQDNLVWWLCKAVRDIILYVLERGAR